VGPFRRRTRQLKQAFGPRVLPVFCLAGTGVADSLSHESGL
jgi:hypothetical protein